MNISTIGSFVPSFTHLGAFPKIATIIAIIGVAIAAIQAVANLPAYQLPRCFGSSGNA